MTLGSGKPSLTNYQTGTYAIFKEAFQNTRKKVTFVWIKAVEQEYKKEV